MAQYNTLHVKVSNSPLSKLKSEIKNGTEVTLKLSSNVVGDSNDENSFPYKLLSTNTKVSKLRKAFANGSSANVKLSKTQLHKIVQSGGFLSRLLGPLLKTAFPLKKNVLKPLVKSVIIPLGSSTSVSATDAANQKKVLGSGHPLDFAPRMTSLIISNKGMNDIIKTANSFEESGWLIKDVIETIKNERKEQKEGFLGMVLDTLGASLLWNLLASKGTVRSGEGTIRVGQDF